MRIVVTGASGFLGRSLCRSLQAAGQDVVGVARRPVPDLPVRLVNSYRETPDGDVLIHLAEANDRAVARAAGERHVREAVSTLEALLAGGYQYAVYASSAVVYGDAAGTARRVGDPTPADDPYARAKLACETLVAAAGGVAARLANLYGPGMAAGNVLSAILAQLAGSDVLRVRDTAPVRDFLWVDDAAAGLAALLSAPRPGLYNLGTGRGVSVRQLCQAVLAAAGQPERPVEETAPSGRPSHLVVDSTATAAAVGWRAQVSLEDGLLRLVKRSGG